MESEKYSIVFVMDQSGSMLNMGDEPWQSLNSFIAEQKTKNNNFTFTLTFFNDSTRFKYQNIESDKIIPLTSSDYVPSGMTSLYDAIGKTIEFQREKTPKNKVIFVILTDGHENCSREYNSYSIKTLISLMEKEYGWKFIYLGANQDAFAVGSNIGIHCSSDYKYTPCGLNNIMRFTSGECGKVISGSKPMENIKFS